MGYVIYHKETTRKLEDRTFKSEAAAKAALTRALKANRNLSRDDYAVAESNDFYDNIELMVERVNLLSGQKYMESVNTPGYMSPASEAYWSA